MDKAIICIDPGAKGAIAQQYGKDKVFVETMPETIGDICDFFGNRGDQLSYKVEAYLENVGQYIPGNSGPAAVSFSRHVGHLEMALFASGIPCVKITPATWMRGIGVPTKLSKAERKRWIKDYVQRRYPKIKVNLQNADALGMLAYVTKG